MKESRLRSIVKSLSYRVWASLLTSLIMYVITGKWNLAIVAGLMDFILKIALFFLHERIWQRISFGQTGAIRIDS